MLAKVLIGIVRFYQVAISSWTPPTCRFTPTCSEYALQSLRSHGAARGSWLAFRRITRCHPWGGHGFDPVPGATPLKSLDAAGSLGSGHMDAK